MDLKPADITHNLGHSRGSTFNGTLAYVTTIICLPDSSVQWQDCRPEYWEAWGPEFNPRQGLVGVQFLFKLGQPLKTFISYSLLSVT